MREFKNKSRKIARDLYWQENDRASYQCPDCDRSEDEILGKFEVHHKNGEAMDNRPENHIGLCRLCHNLREGKKPSKKQIRHLRSQQKTEGDAKTATSSSDTPSVYLAGSMDYESSERQSWRSSVARRHDNGTYEYTGSTPVEINSPSEVMLSHGCGPVEGIAGDDMKLIDDSDAILAYFEKEEQVGTLTEVVYAVTRGKSALVLFNTSLSRVPAFDGADISAGVGYQYQAPTYWFLINFLSGDGWEGLDANIEIRLVESRQDIRSAFRDWSWHGEACADVMSESERGGEEKNQAVLRRVGETGRS